MIAIDLSKQQAHDADAKAIQENNVIGNLDRPEGATMLFIIEETTEIILNFSQRTCLSIAVFFFNIISILKDSI